jgi:DNA processing protein
VNAKEALIALNLIENVGPVRLRHLLDHFGTPEAVLAAGAERLGRVPGIGPETAEAIAHWEESTDLLGELRRIDQFGCTVLTQLDENYPALLREIYDPPIVLYVRGRLLPADRNAIALVGSRQTTSYGVDVARKFGYQLAHLGVTVVSGGARGIDTAAHRDRTWSFRQRTRNSSNASPNPERSSPSSRSTGPRTSSPFPSAIGSWPA